MRLVGHVTDDFTRYDAQLLYVLPVWHVANQTAQELQSSVPHRDIDVVGESQFLGSFAEPPHWLTEEEPGHRTQSFPVPRVEAGRPGRHPGPFIVDPFAERAIPAVEVEHIRIRGYTLRPKHVDEATHQIGFSERRIGVKPRPVNPHLLAFLLEELDHSVVARVGPCRPL
jgi:hypothetical protein